MKDKRLSAGQYLDAQDRDEHALRPKRLADFVGQKQLKDNLGVFIEAARRRRESLDHVFL